MMLKEGDDSLDINAVRANSDVMMINQRTHSFISQISSFTTSLWIDHRPVLNDGCLESHLACSNEGTRGGDQYDVLLWKERKERSPTFSEALLFFAVPSCGRVAFD